MRQIIDSMFTSSSAPGMWRLWPVRLLVLLKPGGFRGTDVSASLTSLSLVANDDSSRRSGGTPSCTSSYISIIGVSNGGSVPLSASFLPAHGYCDRKTLMSDDTKETAVW